MMALVLAPMLAFMRAIPARADIRLAYVDVQRALNECEAGKKAKSEMKVHAQALESRLQHEQDEVQGLRDEIEKKGMLMKPDQRQNLQDDYTKKLTDFERNYKDSKDELERKDNEVTSLIVHDIAQVIREIGEKNGYTMVMEKGSILWGAPGIDITDQVIQTYNRMGVKPGSLDIGSGAGDTSEGEEMGAGSSLSDFGSNAEKRSSISR
jgi:outer membrane protein